MQDLAGAGHADNVVSDLPSTFWVHCSHVAQPFLSLAAQDAREHLLPQLVLLPAHRHTPQLYAHKASAAQPCARPDASGGRQHTTNLSLSSATGCSWAWATGWLCRRLCGTARAGSGSPWNSTLPGAPLRGCPAGGPSPSPSNVTVRGLRMSSSTKSASGSSSSPLLAPKSPSLLSSPPARRSMRQAATWALPGFAAAQGATRGGPGTLAHRHAHTPMIVYVCIAGGCSRIARTKKQKSLKRFRPPQCHTGHSPQMGGDTRGRQQHG